MKKICTLLCGIVVFMYVAKSQYIYISEGSFRNMLMQRYPSCFNANAEMDTTCTQITTEDTLVFHGLTNPYLYGIQYFKALRYLDISTNYSLSGGTWLPASIRYLNTSNNTLLNSINLPDSLRYLDISYCYIQSLPALPQKLDTLICVGELNPFSAYPCLASLPALPAGLRYLDCFNNAIATLPALPNSLRYLNCAYQYQKNNPDKNKCHTRFAFQA